MLQSPAAQRRRKQHAQQGRRVQFRQQRQREHVQNIKFEEPPLAVISGFEANQVFNKQRRREGISFARKEKNADRHKDKQHYPVADI
ncbi:hypothetical protein D3C79_1011830 [compost metagenome]